MKTLYLECSMGAAGDMLTAALLELVSDRDAFLRNMNALGLPNVAICAESVLQNGITGTRMHVTVDGVEEESHDVHAHHVHSEQHDHEHDHHPPHDNHEEEHHGHDHSHGEHHHHHTSMQDIEKIIADMPISSTVKNQVTKVYQLIADAESHAHGKPVAEIHFHEVGTMDAIADITAVCMLMEQIAPDQVIVSPVHVGAGHVHCAHGIMPVPAPATAHILRNVPIYGGAVSGELCTPTGAALLKTFADSFGDMPEMTVEKIGYGFGKKSFAQLNCVRAFLGETADQLESVAELCCNLDDMTGEAIGFAQEILLQAGALDVFTTSVMMKKNRPGILLTVLCMPEDRDQMVRLIFMHTATIGIRETICRRYTLERHENVRETAYGAVRVKKTNGYGVQREKLEYDDIAAIARSQGLSLEQAKKVIFEVGET
ncbi:MAG TPA: nickel pincer cofactor biosynthesis protein LarC [Ruminococcus sp.]|nr:nickel pincer cofactor biosynthesis protein LarC [Ruminococcus sp.]